MALEVSSFQTIAPNMSRSHRQASLETELASAWKYESQALAEHNGERISLMIVKNL